MRVTINCKSCTLLYSITAQVAELGTLFFGALRYLSMLLYCYYYVRFPDHRQLNQPGLTDLQRFSQIYLEIPHHFLG
jgi:hypothetical protein